MTVAASANTAVVWPRGRKDPLVRAIDQRLEEHLDKSQRDGDGGRSSRAPFKWASAARQSAEQGAGCERQLGERRQEWGAAGELGFVGEQIGDRLRCVEDAVELVGLGLMCDQRAEDDDQGVSPRVRSMPARGRAAPGSNGR